MGSLQGRHTCRLLASSMFAASLSTVLLPQLVLLVGAALTAPAEAAATSAGVAPASPLVLRSQGYAVQAFNRFSQGPARRLETSVSTLCLEDAAEGSYAPTVVHTVTQGAMTSAADELGLKALLALTGESRDFVLQAGAHQAQQLQFTRASHGAGELSVAVTELTDMRPRPEAMADLRRLMASARDDGPTLAALSAFKECVAPPAVAGVASDLRLALAQGKKTDMRVQFTDSVGLRWQAILEGSAWEAQADLAGTSVVKALGLFDRWAQLRRVQGLAPRTHVVQTVKHEGAIVFARAWLVGDYADGSKEEARLLFSSTQPLVWHWSLPDSLVRP